MFNSLQKVELNDRHIINRKSLRCHCLFPLYAESHTCHKFLEVVLSKWDRLPLLGLLSKKTRWPGNNAAREKWAALPPAFGAKATLVAFEGVSWSRTTEVVTQTENSSRHLLIKLGTERTGRVITALQGRCWWFRAESPLGCLGRWLMVLIKVKQASEVH